MTQVTGKLDLWEDTVRADPERYLRAVTAGFDGPADKQRKEFNMQYPGRIIKTGERDPEIIRALKTQLNQALGTQDDPALRLDPDEPDFGPKMA